MESLALLLLCVTPLPVTDARACDIAGSDKPGIEVTFKVVPAKSVVIRTVVDDPWNVASAYSDEDEATVILTGQFSNRFYLLWPEKLRGKRTEAKLLLWGGPEGPERDKFIQAIKDGKAVRLWQE